MPSFWLLESCCIRCRFLIRCSYHLLRKTTCGPDFLSKGISQVQPVSCQRWCCLAFTVFRLTEHWQNFLSCSPGSGLFHQTLTNTKPDLSFPLRSVATVTASLPKTEPPHWFSRGRGERQRRLKMERGAGKDEWIAKRGGFYGKIESYIKREGGREKIRGLETSIETGNAKWNRKWQRHTGQDEGKEAALSSILSHRARGKEAENTASGCPNQIHYSAAGSSVTSALTQIAHSLLRLVEMTGRPAAALIIGICLVFFKLWSRHRQKEMKALQWARLPQSPDDRLR